MRLAVTASLVALLLTGAVRAQDGDGSASLPAGFTAGELEEYRGAEDRVREAFRTDDYAGGIEPLERQIGILETVRGRVGEEGYDLGGRDPKSVALEYLVMLQRDLYNLACCLSMTGKTDEALEALEKAIARGYTDLDHMQLDTDLDPLRGEERFRKVIGALSWNGVVEIYVPPDPGEDGPREMIVALHDVGRDEKAAIARWKPVADARGAVLVAPRAPVTRAAGHYAWKRAIDDESAGLAKIRASIQLARTGHALDADRIVLVGEGQGGYFASLFALTFPDAVAGAVPVNAYWNRYSFADFLPAAKERGIAVCFVQGRGDPFRGKAGEGRDQLAATGLAADLVEYEGHRPLRADSAGLVEKAIGFVLSH